MILDNVTLHLRAQYNILYRRRRNLTCCVCLSSRRNLSIAQRRVGRPAPRVGSDKESHSHRLPNSAWRHAPGLMRFGGVARLISSSRWSEVRLLISSCILHSGGSLLGKLNKGSDFPGQDPDSGPLLHTRVSPPTCVEACKCASIDCYTFAPKFLPQKVRYKASPKCFHV